MKVANAKYNNKVTFDKIKKGEVFRYMDRYCMRITDVYIDDYDANEEYIEQAINAIDLKTGACIYHYFKIDELVEPVDCELVINGKEMKTMGDSTKIF